MDWLYTITKAVVQALTEFLPVSSSAHLIITHEVFDALGHPVPDLLADECYDVFLHIGTLLAVVVYFRNELATTLKAAFAQGDDAELTAGLYASKLPLYIAASTIVTVGIVGAVLLISGKLFGLLGIKTDDVGHLVDYYRAHPVWVGWHLMLTGLILLTVEFIQKRQFGREGFREGHTQMTLKRALILGAVQSCSAIFRGISRSGAALAGGMAMGLQRNTAARYAFLMGMPAFVLAAGYEGLKLLQADALHAIDWTKMLTGMVLTAMLGYVVIAFFLRYVGTHRLTGFAWYCLAVGCALAYWLQ